jgi:hypothetical protein
MIAYEGFKTGTWDVTPPMTVGGTDTLVYTYTFVKATTPVEPSDTVAYIVEHYIEKFGEKKFNQIKNKTMDGVAYIVSWNIWQMDGLTYGLPGYTPKHPEEATLFNPDPTPPPPKERFCVIKDFMNGVNINKDKFTRSDFHDLKAPKETFESIVNKKK